MSEGMRVVAAMSGGVDSAVAAGLLKEAGYEVVGVTMKMYAPTRPAHARSCCGADDFDDARRSAAILGIPYYVLDFAEAFRRGVVERFADDYRRGRTPNPCVACNNTVKLGTLRAYADRLGARWIATGHYARLEHGDDGPRLFRSASPKDQSYALAQLTRAQLGRLLLPLGTLDKSETRAHAVRLGLPVATKTESQDICFVEGGDYRDVLARLAPETAVAGDVVTASGELVGAHAGIGGYTVGQRRGLPATGTPRYVTRIDAATNTIVIGDADDLHVRAIVADEVNLIRPARFTPGARMLAMTRYRARPAAATVDIVAAGMPDADDDIDAMPDADDGGAADDNAVMHVAHRNAVMHIAFDEPQRAAAPGQLVALIDADTNEVLGAATIRETLSH